MKRNVAVFFCIFKTGIKKCSNIKYCCTNITSRKGSIRVLWNTIFQNYFYFDKDFKEGVCRSRQGSSLQRGSPDREDTTNNDSGSELELESIMNAVQTSETSVNSYQSTRRYNTKDSHLHSHHREKLKSYLLLLFILSVCNNEKSVSRHRINDSF
jgi:hypothetical protein